MNNSFQQVLHRCYMTTMNHKFSNKWNDTSKLCFLECERECCLGLGRILQGFRGPRQAVQRIARQAVVAPLLGAREVHGAPALVEAPRLVPLQHVEVQPAAAARRRFLSPAQLSLH